MSQYQAIKAVTNAYIRTNGRQEITGAILNAVMVATIDSLGRFYQFVGVATPSTDPGVIDQNIAYLASTPGEYTNLGGVTLDQGEFAVIKFDGEWRKEVVFIIPSKVSELVNDLGYITNAVSDLVNYYTKEETETRLDSFFTKTEVNVLLSGYYDKDEVDSLVSAITSQTFVVSWDGTAEPVIGDIPAGVSVTWNGNTYTGTLPASASTINKIYLVSNGAGYDEYITTESGGYSWVDIGTTTIDLSGYVRQDDFDELEAKVGNPVSEYKDLGQPTAGTFDLSGVSVAPTPTPADYSYFIRETAEEGDVFKVFGKGGSGARLWGFVDGSGNILAVADADEDSRETPAGIVAPSGTAEVIVNLLNYNPLTDSVLKYEVISITEQVETKTSKRLSVYTQSLSSGYYNVSSDPLPTSRTSSSSYKSVILEGNPGDMFQIIGVGSSNTNARLWVTSDSGRSRKRYALQSTNARTNPATITLESGEKYLYVNLYNSQSGDGVSVIRLTADNADLISRVGRLEDGDKRQNEILDPIRLSGKSYPFESGSIKGVSDGTLQYINSSSRLRVDVPVTDVAAVRIVKPGWGIVAWAVYDGSIPTWGRIGDSHSSVASREKVVEIAALISSSVLSFTPERFIMVISKDDDTDISGITSVDDIVQFDLIERSLSGREVVVLGDSSCDVNARDCWAKVLQGRVTAMGVSGFFPGKGGSGWSTDVTLPNANGQWEDIRSGVESLRPVIVITTGGNEIANLQLSYDETIALCKQEITTPANASEWAVYTLRNIINDKPMARIYLVSNFYATSSETKDEQRRTYREMLRALCDFFSITLIDLTRNSQIRGYLENTSGSPGYHLYTPDGTHATEVNGRYLIYAKIMGLVCREEKWNV